MIIAHSMQNVQVKFENKIIIYFFPTLSHDITIVYGCFRALQIPL